MWNYNNKVSLTWNKQNDRFFFLSEITENTVSYSQNSIFANMVNIYKTLDNNSELFMKNTR